MSRAPAEQLQRGFVRSSPPPSPLLPGESQISSLPLPASCQCSPLFFTCRGGPRQASSPSRRRRSPPNKRRCCRWGAPPGVNWTTDLNWPPPSHVCVNRWVASSLAPLCQYHVHLLLSYRFFSSRHGQKKKNRDSERRSCHSSGCPVTRGCRPAQKTGEAVAARACLVAPAPTKDTTKGLAARWSTPRMMTRG